MTLTPADSADRAYRRALDAYWVALGEVQGFAGTAPVERLIKAVRALDEAFQKVEKTRTGE